MDFSILVNYISPIIVLACLIVGYIIKNLIPNEQINNFIPLIVAVLGLALNAWACGAFTLDIAVTGAFSGLASTGFYEAFTNIIKMLPQKKGVENEN